MDAGCESLRIIILLSLTSFYDSGYWLNKLSSSSLFRVNFFYSVLLKLVNLLSVTFRFSLFHFTRWNLCEKIAWKIRFRHFKSSRKNGLDVTTTTHNFLSFRDKNRPQLSRLIFITFQLRRQFTPHVTTLKSPKDKLNGKRLKWENFPDENFSFPSAPEEFSRTELEVKTLVGGTRSIRAFPRSSPWQQNFFIYFARQRAGSLLFLRLSNVCPFQPMEGIFDVCWTQIQEGKGLERGDLKITSLKKGNVRKCFQKVQI